MKTIVAMSSTMNFHLGIDEQGERWPLLALFITDYAYAGVAYREFTMTHGYRWIML